MALTVAAVLSLFSAKRHLVEKAPGANGTRDEALRIAAGRRDLLKKITVVALPVALMLTAQQAVSQGGPVRTRAASRVWQVPRTPEGRPDFTGTWLNDTATPLERPKGLGNRTWFTPDEAEAYLNGGGYLIERLVQAVGEFERQAASEVYEPGPLLKGLRNSLIVDPPNGRLPELTAEGKHRQQQQAERLVTHANETPRNLTNGPRCLLLGNTAVSPMEPIFYNNGLQFLQTKDTLMIMVEMIHDVRIIPIVDQPHPRSNAREWLGISTGRWEGDTLVVVTTNFHPDTGFHGAGPNRRVTERFIRTGPDTIAYQYTVDDPESFVSPFSVESELRRTDSRIYEYACHEGNKAIELILGGARKEEKR
jgi:hypothetical protein